MELKKTQSNKSVVEFSLAITERKANNEGDTNWINFTAWEGRAEALARYLKKGDLVYVFGKLVNQKYQDREGNNRYKMYVLVEGFEFLPNKRDMNDYVYVDDNRYEEEEEHQTIKIDDSDLPFLLNYD